MCIRDRPHPTAKPTLVGLALRGRARAARAGYGGDDPGKRSEEAEKVPGLFCTTRGSCRGGVSPTTTPARVSLMPLAGAGPEWSPEKVREVVDDARKGRETYALAVDDSRTLFSLIDDAQDERTGPAPTSPCGCFIPLDEADEIRRLIKSTRAILARVGKGQT